MIYIKKTYGFTLLEVLITTVIIAFGLLGLTALQLTQLRNTSQSIDGSLAAIYLNDMAERIRSNSTASPNYTATHATLPTKVNCKIQECTSLQMVNSDLYDWQNQIVTTLPSGGGEISQSGGDISIIIRWDQDLSGSTKKNCPTITINDLDCLEVIINI